MTWETQMTFDASCKPELMVCGAAYVIKEYDGKIWKPIATKSIQLAYIGNAAAETEACLAGMRHALELGITRLDIMGDCEATINAVNGNASKKRANLMEVQELRAKFEHVAGYQIDRIANSLADSLASEGTKARYGKGRGR